MKKFLVTGFSGFVSCHFIEYLESNRIRSSVKGLDISSPGYKYRKLKYVKLEFERIDLLDKDKIENVLYRFQPDYILHLASYSSVAFSWQNPIISFHNNTNIYLNLLEAVRKSNLRVRILSIGLSEEYGNVEEKDLPLTEDTLLKPISPYAVACVSQELLSQVYTRGYGLDIVMTRSFNHIGPFQKEIFVIASFVKQLVNIKNSKSDGELIAGDTEIVRDFIDVRDVVAAYYLLLTQGEKGNMYNVCAGVGYSLKTVIDRICDILAIDAKIKLDRNLIRPDDNKKIIGSNQKLRMNFGWETHYTLDRSLSDMINYWELQERSCKEEV